MMMHSDWIGVNHLWWCQNWRGFKCHWGHQVGSLLPLNGLAHSFTHSLTHQVAAVSPVSSRLWLNVLPMDTLTDLGFEPSTSRSLDNPVDLLSSAALSSVQHAVTVWPEMSDCARPDCGVWPPLRGATQSPRPLWAGRPQQVVRQCQLDVTLLKVISQLAAHQVAVGRLPELTASSCLQAVSVPTLTGPHFYVYTYIFTGTLGITPVHVTTQWVQLIKVCVRKNGHKHH